MQSQSWFKLSALLSVLTLAACNKLGQIGQLTSPAPKAVAATIGQPYTVDSSGILHTTVRAGADVVLSGVNSETGDADTGSPIIYFDWTQVNPGSNTVDLIKRATNTSSFTAPQVSQETILTFQLTVRTANGSSATTQAQVVVEPVRDADHFLNFINVSDQFVVTAVTSAQVNAAAAASDATLPFIITVTKLITYTDINGGQHTQVPIGKPVTYSGGWSTALGSGGANCADARNPQLQIPIPRLNLDDVLADGSGHLSDVLETSDVDLDPANSNIPPAQVYAKVEIGSTALATGVTPQLCIGSAGAPASLSAATASATFSSDILTAAANPSGPPNYDTSASAHAYYDTIDPTHAKANLKDWLSANGFNPAVSGWGADAHAIYTNNFDLGLGRDMYLKIGNCDSGFNAAPVSQFASAPLDAPTAQAMQQLIGHCDVASVVVNYVGAQAAALHTNEIVAVAMEYSASVAAGPRFVKFYVFAPDTRSGALQRITSVDLDHRGQKSVPQSCVACHGGTVGTYSVSGGTGTYSNGGNVGAGFISWDLDSLLYSDTDPGFSQKAADAALKAQYTRGAQASQFKLLNVGAYLTTDDPTRYAVERELLEGWYGGAGMPGAFDGTFVPTGWQPGGTNANPADSATIYKNVYARNCRMCHDLQVPAAGVNPLSASATDVNNATVSACSQAGANSNAAAVHQVPMGCFWEFANSRNLIQRLSDGAMPFARRTMDRLWVQADGSMSAGAVLQAHFATQLPPIATPGTSIARVAIPSSTFDFIANLDTSTEPIDIGGAVRLDGTASAFPDVVAWTVAACSGTPSSPGQCARTLPVVGAGSTLAWFLPDDAATYQLTLALDGGQGPATAAPVYFQVPLSLPTFVTPIPAQSVQLGSQVTISPTTLIQAYGNGGAASNLVLVQPGSGLAITPAACAVAPGCAASTIVTGFTVLSTGNTAPVSTSITLTVRGLGSNPAETQTEQVPVTIRSSVTAPALVLPAVAANTTTATNTNLLTAAGGAGAYPNCTSVQVQSVTYQGGRQSVVNFDAGTQVLNYTPQAGFATFSHGGVQQAVCGLNDQPCTQETLQYTLACTLPNSQVQTSSSSINIPVAANNTIGDAAGLWNTAACNTCHRTTSPVVDIAGYPAPDFGNRLAALKTGSLSNDTAIPYVDLRSLALMPPDLSSVDNSGLLCWAQENAVCAGVTPAHYGGQFTDPTVFTSLQQWIEDGANSF